MSLIYRAVPNPQDPYLPSNELVEAVNVAITLEMPLLLEGEPGCGKSRLAEAIAYDLYGEKYKDFFFPLYVKSSSQAKDALYTYDHIARLRDAQMAQLGKLTDNEITQREQLPSKDADYTYLQFGVIGKAFHKDHSEKERPILLIDEIDKANTDFPNDLLFEMENAEFYIPELNNKHIKAKVKPIIIITSNKHQDLPDAFLRRCVYQYIEPHSKEKLTEILAQKVKAADQTLMAAAIDGFLRLREKLGSRNTKKPSTAELIRWFEYLNKQEQARVIDQLNKGELPYKGVLLKNQEDYTNQK